LQGKADGNCAGQFLTVAHPGGVTVGEASVFGKGRPDRLSIALREKGGLVGNFNARALESGNRKLAVPFIQRCAIPAAVEDNSFHPAD
jgi:hypothetical protein